MNSYDEIKKRHDIAYVEYTEGYLDTIPDEMRRQVIIFNYEEYLEDSFVTLRKIIHDNLHVIYPTLYIKYEKYLEEHSNQHEMSFEDYLVSIEGLNVYDE